MFIFDPGSYKLTQMSRNKEIRLSYKEASVLALLCMNAQQVVRRDFLLTEIWHDGVGCDSNLNKSILRLRRKFESIGLLDAISTVPRVGYMLSLPVERVYINAEQSFLDEKIDTVSKETLINTSRASGIASFLKKNTLIVFLLFVLFAILLIPNYNGNFKNSVVVDKIIPIRTLGKKNDGRYVFYTNDIDSPTQYIYFESLIDKSKLFYVLLSRRALSYVDVDVKTGLTLQKIFFIDRNQDIKLQLNCIAKHINNDDGNVKLRTSKSNGPSIIYSDFYRACLKKAVFLGELKVLSTRSSGDDFERATWTQDVTFITSRNEIAFNFKRISRDRFYKNNISHLDVKSFSVKKIKQSFLQRDDDISYLFNQLTQDDTYQVGIIPEKRIYVSSLFGGVIYSK